MAEEKKQEQLSFRQVLDKSAKVSLEKYPDPVSLLAADMRGGLSCHEAVRSVFCLLATAVQFYVTTSAGIQNRRSRGPLDPLSPDQPLFRPPYNSMLTSGPMTAWSS